jgi:hypothetical protein
MAAREINTGRVGPYPGPARESKGEDAPQTSGRIELALLIAGAIVASIAVIATAGAKALARWSGAE